MLLGFINIDDYDSHWDDEEPDNEDPGYSLWPVFIFTLVITFIFGMLLVATSDEQQHIDRNVPTILILDRPAESDRLLAN